MGEKNIGDLKIPFPSIYIILYYSIPNPILLIEQIPFKTFI